MSSAGNTRMRLPDRLGSIMDGGLPLLGVAVVLVAVMTGGGGWGAIWLAVAGLLLVEAGVWRLGSRILNERRYLPLRREVEQFVDLARDLNHAAVTDRGTTDAADGETLDATVAAMHDSVDRMRVVAGLTDAEVESASASEEARRELAHG